MHKQYKYNKKISISKSQAICQYINRLELVWNKRILNILLFLLAYQFNQLKLLKSEILHILKTLCLYAVNIRNSSFKYKLKELSKHCVVHCTFMIHNEK